MTQAVRERDWYREPLVWFVISLPTSAVIAGFWTLYLAISSADGLVVDDYYKEGLAINRQIERDAEASALGLKADVTLSRDHLVIALDARQPSDVPAELNVSLLNATRAGLDRKLVLKPSGPGHYETDLSPLPAGHWRIHMEAANWRLVSSARTP